MEEEEMEEQMEEEEGSRSPLPGTPWSWKSHRLFL
jgi:hypothetical protein